MREIVKKCILVYNLLALPFVFLTVLTYIPETSFSAKLSDLVFNGITVLYAALTLLLQNLWIPQIVAAVLVGLYTYDILRNREFFPFRWEKRSFFLLSAWTILSALCILLGCLAMADGIGEPLP